MDIGSELRTAREAHALSLDDIACATKISHSVLRAIESNAFHNVPGGLFARGYLRAYAHVVGLDPEAVVQHYRAEFDAPEPPGPGATPKPAALIDADVAFRIAEEETDSRHGQILQTAVILVVALVYLASLRQTKPAAHVDLPAADAVAALAAAAVPAEALPVGTSGSTSTVKPGLAIDIHPLGPCWVDVTVDGKHTLGRLMNAGDRETVTAGEDLILRVGDPAAFAFSIDGVAGRSLGSEGHPVTVRINRTNYRTLLSGPQRD